MVMIDKKKKIKSPSSPGLPKFKLKSANELNEFAENIINTVREPLLVLDQDLRVVKASRSFYDFFKVNSDVTIGSLIYDLGNRQWDIPKLRELLETILPEKTMFDNYEVEHDFSTIGKRIMLLNARQIERAFGKEKIILLAIEDITDRKLSEESVSETSRVTNEYLDILFNHAYAPIIVWDSSGVIIHINKAFENLSGYDWTEVRDKKIEILFPKEKVDLTLDLIKNTLINDERPDLIEVEILTKKNVLKTVLWNPANIFDKEGKHIVATIAQDITSRKLDEGLLRESEERYRSFFENSMDAIMLTIPDGRILSANPVSCKIFGYSQEELIKVGQFGIVDNMDPILPNLLMERRLNGHAHGELTMIRKDGTRFPAEISSAIFKNQEGFERTSMIIRDISERKEAEHKVLESEKRFRAIFDQAPIAIALLDKQGHPVISNLPLSKMIGYSSTELSKMKFTDFTFLDDINKDMNQFNDLIDGKISKYSMEKRFVHKNGNLVWINLSVTILHDEDGASHEILGMAEDITERKKAEEKMIQLSAIVESSDEIIISKTLDGIITNWNKGAEKVYGYNESEVIGLPISLLLPVAHKDEIPEILEKIKYGLSVDNFESERITKDGRLIQVSLTISPIKNRDGEITGVSTIGHDITEHKQAEEKLRDSEERFRHSFDYAATGVCIVGTDQKFLKINKAFKEMIGYKENEILNFTFSDITHPDDLSIGVSQLKKMMDGKIDIASFEKRYIRKDKEIIWAHVSISLVRNSNNQPQFFITQVIDITEQKRAEEEITMLAHSLRSIKECVSITDMEDKIIFINESFLKTYGYDENELVGKNMKMVRSSKNPHELVNKILPSTILGGWQGELWNKRKNGSEFLINLSTTVINDDNGKPLGLIGVATDITEKKKMETDLSSAAEIAKLGYWEYDVDSEQFTFNDQYYRLIHGTSTEKQGGNIMSAEEFVRRFVYPDDATMIAKNLQEAISSPNPDYFGKAEIRVFRDDENIANVSVQFKILKDSSGRTYKVYGVNQDITDSKRTEKELIEAKEKAEQSDKLKTEFLAQMSHEIRSPMNAVVSFANLLKEDLEGKITPQLLEYLDGIDSAGHRLIRTVELILNASELQVGTFVPNFIDIDLIGEILEKINKEYILLAQEKGLKFNFNTELTEVIIHGDKYSIYQLFVNLMDNAVKYTNKGSISVKVEKNKDAPEEIKVSIEDTGIGMSEIFMEQMYNQFTQEDRGYSRRYEGNGLGLSLVKKYCSLNGITIEVESKKGIGSKFTLFLTSKK
ncbi:MAG: PAS domain S-box protein [Ignavibacteriales bacterium]|nr:PAS domain S-box protein [Ignavibacteriales bacterium]